MGLPERMEITTPARYNFTAEQVKAVRATIASGATDEEFVLYTELIARYSLDPFARQVWLAKMKGENGPMSVIIGRDGYLAIAERHPAYEGMDGDVVREGDRFEVVRGPQGPQVVHEYGEKHCTAAILGAWATVYRSDRRVPTYFFAPVKDYKPTGRKLEVTPWGKQESAMILKCAHANALRLAFNISGFVPAEEMDRNQGGLVNGAVDTGEISMDPDTFNWGEDEELEAKLRALVERANETREGSVRPQKLRALLLGRDDHGRRMLAREIEEFIVRKGGVLPGAEPVATEPEEPGPVMDATVVEDDDSARIAAEVFGTSA